MIYARLLTLCLAVAGLIWIAVAPASKPIPAPVMLAWSAWMFLFAYLTYREARTLKLRAQERH